MSRRLPVRISTTEYIRRVKTWNKLISGLLPLCTDVLNKLMSLISYTEVNKSKKLTKSQIEQKTRLDDVVNEILSATSNISLTKNYLKHSERYDGPYRSNYTSLYELIEIEKELYPGDSSIEQLLSMLKVKDSHNHHFIIEYANVRDEARAKKVSYMSDIEIETFRKNSRKQIRDAERNYIDFKLKKVHPNLSIIIEEYQNKARKEIFEKEIEDREERSRVWKEKQKISNAKKKWLGIIALISFLFILIILVYYFKWLGFIIALISLFSVFIYSYYK